MIGTPAEEGRCGKHDLIAAGAFTSVDVAMMAHPSQYTLARPKYTSMIPLVFNAKNFLYQVMILMIDLIHIHSMQTFFGHLIV